MRVTPRLDRALREFVRPGSHTGFGRDEEIYGEGEPADFVYRVVTGVVRNYRTLSDGRRQVSDFHVAADYFGLETGLEHRMTAEAVGEATVQVIRRGILVALAMRDNGIARELWALAAQRLQRSQDHVLILGRKNAAERVAGFLLDHAARAKGGDAFDLPMSRQDIADFLGLTMETVSRTFSQLEGAGVIQAHNSRRVRLTDRPALELLSE
jgi:CRP/FNR family nitrogen fixation transcriptional regulator